MEVGDEKADRETQVARQSSKLEAAVSQFSVLNGAVAELRADLCAVPSTATEDGRDACR